MNGSHVEDVVPSVVSIGLHLTADLFHAATGKEHVRTIDLVECYSLRMPKVWLLMHIAFEDTCRRNKPFLNPYVSLEESQQSHTSLRSRSMSSFSN